MKHLTRIILIAFVFAVFAMPVLADTANERVSQWKKDRLAEARGSQPIGASSGSGGASDDGSATWSREEGSRFGRDGRANDNSDRFPWAAPGLTPNNPNGAASQSQQSDQPTGDDADGWWWEWFSSMADDESDFDDDDSSDDGDDDDDDDGDDDDDDDMSPSNPARSDTLTSDIMNALRFLRGAFFFV